MDLNLRINIDLAKSTNYIPMGFWVQPVAGDPKKPFYRITDLGIPMVKVEDGSALGYSVYVLNVDVSDDVVPSASNPQWRLIESAELIYIQQAFIERLWTQMLIAEGAEIGGFEIKDGLFSSSSKYSNVPNLKISGNDGSISIPHSNNLFDLLNIKRFTRTEYVSGMYVLAQYVKFIANLPTDGDGVDYGMLYVDSNGFVKIKQ